MRVITLFLIVSIASPLFAQKKPVELSITLTAPSTQKLNSFLKDKEITRLDNLTSPLIDTNDVLEALIFIKSLVRGGLHPKISTTIIPNSAREREFINDGGATAAGTSQWLFYAAKYSNCYFTETVIPDGFFEKGLYTTKIKSESIQLKSIKEAQRYTVAINKGWVMDWEVAESLKFKRIFDTPTRLTMFDMVHSDRADFTFQSFSSNPDLSSKEGGITLYPVHGVKIILHGTRHYMINKKAPHALEIYHASNKGLAIMRKSGEIMRDLRQAGFNNPATARWKILNPK